MALVEGSRTSGSTVLAQGPVPTAEAKPKAQNVAARWKGGHDAAKVQRTQQAEYSTSYCLQQQAARAEELAARTESQEVKVSGADRLAALGRRLQAKEAGAA